MLSILIMELEQLAQNHAVLEKILACQDADMGSDSVSNLTLCFEDGEQLILGVDIDTDELVWDAPYPRNVKVVDLKEIFPSTANTYGLLLAWSWQMTNHQGYFDALQLELTNADLAQTMILQFKVVASNIEIFTVERSAAIT